MKIYKNFYFWYLAIYLFFTIAAFSMNNAVSENFFVQLTGSVWFFMSLGLLPVGISQVFMSMKFYMERREKYWFTYFCFLAFFLLSILLSVVTKEQMVETIVSTVYIISPIICYITHLILYHFHTKKQTA